MLEALMVLVEEPGTENGIKIGLQDVPASGETVLADQDDNGHRRWPV